MTSLENRLLDAGIAAEDIADTFALVQTIANDTRAPLAATGELFATLQRISGELGADLNQVAVVTQTIQQAFALAGASISEAEGATRQLIQGLQSGTLRGEELNSVLENAPVIARLIADELGVTLGELRALAAEGELTSEVVFGALLNGSIEVNERFSETTATFQQQRTLIANSLIPVFGELANAIQPVVSSFAAFAVMNPELTALGVALGAIAASAAILGGPVTAVAAAIGAGLVVWQNWDEIVGFFNERWMAFTDLLDRGGESVIRALERIIAPIREFITRLREFGEAIGLLESANSVFEDTANAIDAFGTNTLRDSQAARQEIEDLFRAFANGEDVTEAAVARIIELMDMMSFTSAAAAERFRDLVLGALQETADEAVFGSIVPDMVMAIEDWMNRVPEIGENAGTGFRENFIRELELTMDEAVRGLDDLRSTFERGFGNFLTGRGSGGDLARGLLGSITNTIIGNFTRSISSGLFGASGTSGSGLFGNLFGGFFQDGGIVPGPVGAPRIIIAHGGEEVIPVGGSGNSGNTININITGDVSRQTREIIDREVPRIVANIDNFRGEQV